MAVKRPSRLPSRSRLFAAALVGVLAILTAGASGTVAAGGSATASGEVSLTGHALGVILLGRGLHAGPTAFWLIQVLGAAPAAQHYAIDVATSSGGEGLKGKKFAEPSLRLAVEAHIQFRMADPQGRFFAPFLPKTRVDVRGLWIGGAASGERVSLPLPTHDMLEGQSHDFYAFEANTAMVSLPLVRKAQVLAVSAPR